MMMMDVNAEPVVEDCTIKGHGREIDEVGTASAFLAKYEDLRRQMELLRQQAETLQKQMMENEGRYRSITVEAMAHWNMQLVVDHIDLQNRLEDFCGPEKHKTITDQLKTLKDLRTEFKEKKEEKKRLDEVYAAIPVSSPTHPHLHSPARVNKHPTGPALAPESEAGAQAAPTDRNPEETTVLPIHPSPPLSSLERDMPEGPADPTRPESPKAIVDGPDIFSTERSEAENAVEK